MNWARILPHPLFSGVLFVCWLWLNDTLEPGHMALALVLAIAIPAFTHRYWTERLKVRRPGALIAYCAMVLWDIVVANVEVAILVLGPTSRLKSGFVHVPLELRSDFAITLLASTITLTPGTVSVEITPDRRTLVVHYLSSDNPEELVRTMKQRYEARIREIFEC